MQWVISPARTHAPTPETKDKLAEPNFLAVCRLASRGENADTLIRHLYTSLGSTNTYGMRFVRRDVFPSQVKERIRRRAGMLAYPSTLNALELSVLLGFPFGTPNVSGLPAGHSRQLAADHMIPQTGARIGVSNFPGMEQRALAIPFKSLLMHQHILGPTGTGKSTLLHNEAVDIMRAGLGLVVLEPKGDLARNILRSVPPERVGDVIWFDPTDRERPIGLNLFSGPDPGRSAVLVVSLFKQLFGDSWGPRLEWIFKYICLTAALNGLTIVDAMELLTNKGFRDREVRKIKDRVVRGFWSDFDDGPEMAKQSVINKIDAFAGFGSTRNIVGQTQGLNISEVVAQGKILLVPMPSVELEASGALLGSILINQLWNAKRQRRSGETILMIDEFQNYLGLSVSMQQLLAEARGWGLGLILANQDTKDLGDKVFSAVIANARTKIMFGHGHQDADKMHKEFGPLTAGDLQTLAQYEAAAQIMTETGTAPVATVRTMPAPAPTNDGHALIAASRSTYGRDYKDVENELARRHRDSESERKLPKIEGLD